MQDIQEQGVAKGDSFSLNITERGKKNELSFSHSFSLNTLTECKIFPSEQNKAIYIPASENGQSGFLITHKTHERGGITNYYLQIIKEGEIVSIANENFERNTKFPELKVDMEKLNGQTLVDLNNPDIAHIQFKVGETSLTLYKYGPREFSEAESVALGQKYPNDFETSKSPLLINVEKGNIKVYGADVFTIIKNDMDGDGDHDRIDDKIQMEVTTKIFMEVLCGSLAEMPFFKKLLDSLTKRIASSIPL